MTMSSKSIQKAEAIKCDVFISNPTTHIESVSENLELNLLLVTELKPE
jgi:hypothetical protein